VSWPSRGDTALDRARIVARTCWQALHRRDPGAATELASVFAAVGETWLAPPAAPALDPGEWVPAARIAGVLQVQPQRVRKWGQRGQVPHKIDPATGWPLFRLADCQARLVLARRLRAAGEQQP